MSSLIEVTDDNFKEVVLEAAVPVLVDFYGSWCGPCKKLKPVIEELAENFAGRAKVVELEVSTAPQTAAEYGVMGVPTLMLFNNGEPKDTLVGGAAKADLVTLLEEYIK